MVVSQDLRVIIVSRRSDGVAFHSSHVHDAAVQIAGDANCSIHVRGIASDAPEYNRVGSIRIRYRSEGVRVETLSVRNGIRLVQAAVKRAIQVGGAGYRAENRHA